MKTLVLFFSFIFATSSVFAYKPINEEQRAELFASFQFDPEARFTKKPSASCNGHDMEYQATYPRLQQALNIKAKAYIPAVSNGAQVPMIIILPPLGGANTLDRGLAETFCKNKMAALIITTDLTGIESGELMPVSDHDEAPRRVAAAIRGAMQLLATLPEINSEKVGLFGASLGGILGSITYAVVPEISAATFLVNGGDAPHILAHSDQPKVISLKNKRMKEQNLKTDAEYERFLNENLNIDPMHLAKFIDPTTLKMYLSKNDKSVPTSRQMMFYEAIGKPANTKFYNSGHIPTIVNIMGLSGEKNKISDWFTERFKLDNPRMQEQL